MDAHADEDAQLQSAALETSRSILQARRRAEEELKTARARLAAILDATPVGILLVDSSLLVQHVNPRALPVFCEVGDPVGRALEEVLARLWPAEVAREHLARFRHTLATGEPHRETGFSEVRADLHVRQHYDWELQRISLPGGERAVACYFVEVSRHVQAQQALRESEQRVRATFDQAGVGIALAELDGRFVQVNRKFTEILGYAADELCARTFADVTHSDDLEPTRREVQRLLAGEANDYVLENRYVRKDGAIVWSRTTVALMRDVQGRPEHFVGVVVDISDRRRAEEAERVSAQRLQLALAAGRLGDWSWDARTDLVALSPRAAEIFGVSESRPILRAALQELLDPEDVEAARRSVERALEEGTDHDVEYRVARRGGGDGWVAVKGHGVYGPDGDVVGMVGVVQDVTERRRLEEVRFRMAAVVESSDDAIVSKDLTGIIRTWNSGAERMFGYSAGEVIGRPVTVLIPPERLHEEGEILPRLQRGERIEHLETVRVRKDGVRIDVALTISPVRDAAGRIVGASKIARDITERKRAQERLRRSEEELRALADSIPQLAWMAHPDGHIFWFNRGWYEYTGTTPEQMEGWGWQAVHDPAVLPRVLEVWGESLRTGRDFEMEFPLRGKDREFRWFLTRVKPIRDAGGAVLRWFGTNTDVHQVRRAQDALREETRVLELLNETLTSIAGDLDLQTLVQRVTDAATQLAGARFGAFFYNVEDEHGDAFQLFSLSGAPREAFEQFGHPRATPLLAPTFQGQGPIRCDDVALDPRYGRFAPHHGMPRWHLPVRSYMAVPVVSRNGDVLGGLLFGHPEPGVFGERIERVLVGVAAQTAVAMDNARLYERVKRSAEERSLLLEAERSARAEAERASQVKDEFLANLSHELRTPLNAIVGWSQILGGRDDLDERTREGLGVIRRNARVQAELISDLLDMNRILSGKLRLEEQRVELQDVVRAAVESVRPAAEAKGVLLEVDLDGRPALVRGDPARLQQCLWNLLSNALKFTPRNGRVSVRLGRAGSRVELRVADDGEGLAPEFLPHLFERFRQADPSITRRHGGLGLGLSIVKSLVELHGGTVGASSAGPGRGATFTIELPLLAVDPHGLDALRGGAGEPRPPEPRFDHPSLTGIRVLCVDDDPDALGLVKRLLEDCGARVQLATSADEALASLARERPDLILSDLGMPGTDGFELMRRVRRQSPEHGGRTPAVALSAFARAEDRTRALRAGYQAHVAKPVEPAELTAIVASMALRR